MGSGATGGCFWITSAGAKHVVTVVTKGIRMKLSICAYSFHRMIGNKEQDIFKYITDCKALGCTHLHPWYGQFADAPSYEALDSLGSDPSKCDVPEWAQPPQDDGYLREFGRAALDAGLPVECLAVDRAHIYEPDIAQREINRRLAERWVDIAGIIGAEMVRIDAGGPAEMPADVLTTIVGGYHRLISRAADRGVRVIFENHWGPTRHPENVVRLLETVEGLGYLFDSNNWAEGRQEEGWRRCARFADATHITTVEFDEAGNEKTADLPEAIRLLVESGYDGCWGIESCTRDEDELRSVRMSIELLRWSLERLAVS